MAEPNPKGGVFWISLFALARVEGADKGRAREIADRLQEEYGIRTVDEEATDEIISRLLEMVEEE